MESTTPFQPWTAGDESKNVKTEREVADDAKHRRENVNHPKHTQTASYDKGSDSTASDTPGSSKTPGVSGAAECAVESKMDSGKITSMQQIVENTLSQESRQQVTQLLEAIEGLSGTERLLLYLRLPTGVPIHDPLKQPVNPLGSRAELQQTVTWIQSHLEVDPDVSLPKQDVYDEYIAHCMSSNMKPLSTADFGKVMKQVYPSVRPRRLGTRGNSRYCYAGLRKRVKLEVPQLPDLGESVKDAVSTPRNSEKIVCDWAETKLGLKFSNILELSRHLVSLSATQRVLPRPDSCTPPPLLPSHAPVDESPNRQSLKSSIKRKIQTQGTPGRPKKNKSQELARDSPPSTSYTGHHSSVKHEGEMTQEAAGYGYQPPYAAVGYDSRAFQYTTPLRVHPSHPSHSPHHSHPSHLSPTPHPTHPAHPTHQPQPCPVTHPSMHDYRTDPYVYESGYPPRDFTHPPDTAYNVPINLSTDASLDLSTERTEWHRRKPPEPPPARLPLPGKKLILETYQSETQTSSPRSTQIETRPIQQPQEEFPREYLPKKMRAAEILGGKLAAARQPLVPPESASTSSSTVQDSSVRSDVTFLEDPKNATSRSKSTAAALAREDQEAASPIVGKAPTPTPDRTKPQKPTSNITASSPNQVESPKRIGSPDSCCGLDGINIKTGMICEEKHSEILNRERVISICNIDKHDLDDYLNEGNSQEHEEELLQYFHSRAREAQETITDSNTPDGSVAFLEAGLDQHDEHSQGKNEKISQLRELLAKNLKNQRYLPTPHDCSITDKKQKVVLENTRSLVEDGKSNLEGAFKPVLLDNVADPVNKSAPIHKNNIENKKHCNSINNENGVYVSYNNDSSTNQQLINIGIPHIYNGNSQNVPQSPTTRTQQYDFVPISDGCHSPRNFTSKSPLGFGQRGHSPSKTNKTILMSNSLQTSPISHSTAASPFVSPRNTPVPRSRVCSRPIPKHNGRRRRNMPSLGVNDPCSKQFAVPNKSTTVCNSGIKYCQPMSAPPSPNILSSQYKNLFICNSGLPNGTTNHNLNFSPNTSFREQNGEVSQPLSADPLSSEVSRFFQEPMVNYNRIEHDSSFRSQSVPLKQGINIGLLSYNNTPAGSVPPTPVPNEFCDFGSLADTCDISKAGLNPETLDKIYDAIDSSNDVLNTDTTQSLLNSHNDCNGCDTLPPQEILTDELNSLISNDGELLTRGNQFSQPFGEDNCSTSNNVENFLKTANIIEFNYSEMESEKSKYYMSRSVPSTPLPYKRPVPALHIDSRRQRALFSAENFYNGTNNLSSKSVPSTPQMIEDNNVFNYSNRDFLINGNSLDVCAPPHISSNIVDNQGLGSPLHDILPEEMSEPLTPAADLLADLEKIDSASYDDL